MGGAVESLETASEIQLEEQLKTSFGEHVTKDWLVSHGLDMPSASDPLLGATLEKLGKDIETISAREMEELDEEWAQKARKATHQIGKRSLLSGAETGRGGGEATQTSLLA